MLSARGGADSLIWQVDADNIQEGKLRIVTSPQMRLQEWAGMVLRQYQSARDTERVLHGPSASDH